MVAFHLIDDLVTSHDSLEKHLDVGDCTLRSLIVGIEILSLKDRSPGNAIASKALLLPHLRVVEQYVDSSCITKVWPIAHAPEHFQRNAAPLRSGYEGLRLQLRIEDDSHLSVGKIFEEKA